jgi:hypothetical protein
MKLSEKMAYSHGTKNDAEYRLSEGNEALLQNDVQEAIRCYECALRSAEDIKNQATRNGLTCLAMIKYLMLKE